MPNVAVVCPLSGDFPAFRPIRRRSQELAQLALPRYPSLVAFPVILTSTGRGRFWTGNADQPFTACAMTLRMTVGSALSVMRSISTQALPGASLASRAVLAVARATASSR